MGRYRDRWPRQAWLCDLADVRPQGEPETQVFTGTSVLLALHVRGLEHPEVLAIRWEAGPVSAVIASGGIAFDEGEARFHIDDGDGC